MLGLREHEERGGELKRGSKVPGSWRKKKASQESLRSKIKKKVLIFVLEKDLVSKKS